MPPRDQLILSLRALSSMFFPVQIIYKLLTGTVRSPSSTCLTTRAFTSSAVDQASTVQQRRRHRDPYALAQARARKAANLSRQEVLKKERASALGDPVRGMTTPFVQSFDTALPPTPSPQQSQSTHAAVRNESGTADQPPPGPSAQNDSHLNFFLNQSEVASSLQRSKSFTVPAEPDASKDSTANDGRTYEVYEEDVGAHNAEHTAAMEAINRLTSLANGSSKDRLRVNVQRCISTFGRHNTEQTLPPRAPSVLQPTMQMQKMPRAGVDTGSSEVQIAILTAKIRTLANFLETRGKTDKINKRNLRVLVHKRQKLLSYLRRKERGGPRWTHCIETLGLTEGTWRGEISL